MSHFTAPEPAPEPGGVRWPPDTAPPSPRPVRWGWGHALGSLVGFLVVSTGAVLGLHQLGVDPIAASALATFLGWIPLAGWPLIVASRRGNGVRSDLGLRFRPVDLGIGVAAAVVALVAAYVFLIIYVEVTGALPNSLLGEVAEQAVHPWQVVALAAVALGAPFVEEVHFRGMWWSALERKGFPGWLTLIATSLLFASIHLEVERITLLFAMALVLGFVRWRTNRLGPAIVTHFLINGLAVAGLLAAV